MRGIAIFGGSHETIEQPIIEEVTSLGSHLASLDFSYVCAGINSGLIGNFAASCISNGGRVEGVLLPNETPIEGLARKQLVTSTAERHGTLLKDVVACVALPGGMGTISELAFAMARKQARELSATILVLNVSGFFDDFIRLVERASNARLQHPSHLSSVIFASTAGEAVRRLSELLIPGSNLDSSKIRGASSSG